MARHKVITNKEAKQITYEEALVFQQNIHGYYKEIITGALRTMLERELPDDAKELAKFVAYHRGDYNASSKYQKLKPDERRNLTLTKGECQSVVTTLYQGGSERCVYSQVIAIMSPSPEEPYAPTPTMRRILTELQSEALENLGACDKAEGESFKQSHADRVANGLREALHDATTVGDGKERRDRSNSDLERAFSSKNTLIGYLLDHNLVQGRLQASIRTILSNMPNYVNKLGITFRGFNNDAPDKGDDYRRARDLGILYPIREVFKPKTPFEEQACNAISGKIASHLEENHYPIIGCNIEFGGQLQRFLELKKMQGQYQTAPMNDQDQNVLVRDFFQYRATKQRLEADTSFVISLATTYLHSPFSVLAYSPDVSQDQERKAFLERSVQLVEKSRSARGPGNVRHSTFRVDPAAAQRALEATLAREREDELRRKQKEMAAAPPPPPLQLRSITGNGMVDLGNGDRRVKSARGTGTRRTVSEHTFKVPGDGKAPDTPPTAARPASVDRVKAHRGHSKSVLVPRRGSAPNGVPLGNGISREEIERQGDLASSAGTLMARGDSENGLKRMGGRKGGVPRSPSMSAIAGGSILAAGGGNNGIKDVLETLFAQRTAEGDGEEKPNKRKKSGRKKHESKRTAPGSGHAEEVTRNPVYQNGSASRT